MENVMPSPNDETLGERFLAQGYVICPVEDRDSLLRLRRRIGELAAGHLGREVPEDIGAFLDGIASEVTVQDLNALRLAVINGISAEPWFRPAYLALARKALEQLVGNELVMQRRIGLSVQLPDDDSSLLPVHADVWDGDSAFEVVVWLPLVDCFATKSMYLMPPAADRDMQQRMASLNRASAEDLFQLIEKDVVFLDVPFGSVLVFSQTLMHGNRVNREAQTRWSMNCRFKSLFSPYADKRLGEFFEPVDIRPVTRIGMEYQLPGRFDE